jgi:Holliday junction resolvase
LEHRVERLYASHGWLSTRYPKSGRRLYPADVLALKRIGGKTVIHLVECKNLSRETRNTNLYLDRSQVQKLIVTAAKHDARALVAYSFPRQHARIMDANELNSSGKMLCIGKMDGVPLKKFLQSFA